MPGKGYFILNLKPITIEKLQNITDRMYSGMFIPSTLIIMMNEVTNGYYAVDTHKVSPDLSGHYVSVTIRSDVHDWLAKNFEEFAEEYKKIYHIKYFTKFVNYFIINMIESKNDSQNMSINLDKFNFEWLQSEYQKTNTYQLTFEEFTNNHIHDLFLKTKTDV